MPIKDPAQELARMRLSLWRRTGHVVPLTRRGFDIYYREISRAGENPKAVIMQDTATMEAAILVPERKDTLARAFAELRSGPYIVALTSAARRSNMPSDEMERMLAGLFDFTVPDNAGLTAEEHRHVDLERMILDEALQKGYCSPTGTAPGASLTAKEHEWLRAALATRGKGDRSH